jgi:hypothetical protein
MHKSVEEKAKNFPYQQVNTGYSVNLSKWAFFYFEQSTYKGFWY